MHLAIAVASLVHLVFIAEFFFLSEGGQLNQKHENQTPILEKDKKSIEKDHNWYHMGKFNPGQSQDFKQET